MAWLQSSDPAASSNCISLLVLLLLLIPAVAAVEYSSVCLSPAAAPDLPAGSRRSTYLRPPSPSGYFSGGEELLFNPTTGFPVSFFFIHRRARETTDPAVLRLSATLTLSGARLHRWHEGVRPHSVSFDLDGYFYYPAGGGDAELCMVGSGSRAREDGSGVVLLRDVVLRLRFPRPANLSRPFVTGRLEGEGFSPVTLVAYAGDDDYKYGQRASCPAPPDTVRDSPAVLKAHFSCHRLKALIGVGYYDLAYRRGAAGDKPATFPVQPGHRIMAVSQMDCDKTGAVRAYFVFFNDSGDYSSSSRTFFNGSVFRRAGGAIVVGEEELVADGFWDSSRNQLCLKACPVARSRPAGADMSVRRAGCSIGMSFWFPSVWSITNRSAVAGLIWNATAAGESTPSVVSASRTGHSYLDNLAGVSYNYTRLNEAKKHHDSNPELSKPRDGTFPGNYSYHDFAFSFFSGELGAYGYASPVALGATVVDTDRPTAYGGPAATGKLLNVAYDVRVRHYKVQRDGLSSPGGNDWIVAAEGVYDSEAGSLCMVGCRVVGGGSPDCEVLVTVRFAPAEAESRRRAAGKVSSLRKKEDQLFFEAVEIVADGVYEVQVGESIWRMDMESTMVVLSMTLSCVFTLLQLRHASRSPASLPATSVTMLAVLALGYLVPLTLNLEAMVGGGGDGGWSISRQFVQLTSGGGSLDLNEVLLRGSTVLAFVLQLRLLQLAWSARRWPPSTDQGGRRLADAERSTLWVCLPLYLLGGAVIWIVHMNDGAYGGVPFSRRRSRRPAAATLSDDLVSYAGLILDGFLLPQVVFNAFSASTAAAISPWFYAGGAAIRSAPHAYDALRARSFMPTAGDWNATRADLTRAPSSHLYAGPRDGIYGGAWDAAVPCAAAALAVLVFLQQRHGGAVVCCVKRRRSGEYEMVPTATS